MDNDSRTVLCLAAETFNHENGTVLEESMELHPQLVGVRICGPIARSEDRKSEDQLRPILYSYRFPIQPHEQKEKSRVNQKKADKRETLAVQK
jgi:hypothetical protein